MSPDRPNLDELMRRATDDLRDAVADIDVAPFRPTPRRAPLAAAAAVVAVAVGVGVVATRSADDTIVSTPSEASVPESADDTTTVASAVDPSTTVAPAAPVVSLDEEVGAPEPLARPEPAASVNDPAFGTEVTRLTASEPGEYVVPVATLTSAWNADETRLLLYRTTDDGGAEHRVYDPTTGSFSVVDISPTDIEEVAWSPTDPDVLVFVDDRSLVTHDVTNGQTTVVRTFDDCDEIATAVGGAGLSADGDVIALACLTANREDGAGAGNAADSIVSYRFSTDEVVQVEREQNTELFTQAPGVAPSGTRFVFPTGERTADVLDEQLLPTGIVIDPLATIATDASGADIAVGPSFSGDAIGSIVTIDLVTGDERVVVGPDTGAPFPPGGNTVSASGPFVVFSTRGLTSDVDASEWLPLDGEVVLVDFSEAEPAVMRLAHSRTSDSDTWSSTFVSISPSGTRIAFSSDWGDASSVDTYVIDLG